MGRIYETIATNLHKEVVVKEELLSRNTDDSNL